MTLFVQVVLIELIRSIFDPLWLVEGMGEVLFDIQFVGNTGQIECARTGAFDLLV
jgi:hypothetical protein